MVWGPMLDDPQGQKQFSVAGVPLSEPVPAADPHRRHCADPRRRRRRQQPPPPLRSGSAFLADWQGQTPLTTGVWSSGAFNITPDHEMIPG